MLASLRRSQMLLSYVGLCPGQSIQSSLCKATKPVPVIPSARALPRDKLSTDVRVEGPRSLMRTTTDRPFAWFTPRSRVPNGSVRWAAVSRFGSNISPLAVRPDCAYHVARPLPIRGHAFWRDRLPCRGSRYGLSFGRLQGLTPGLGRRAGCLGWRGKPPLENACGPFVFAGFVRMLMHGIGWRARVDARW